MHDTNIWLGGAEVPATQREPVHDRWTGAPFAEVAIADAALCRRAVDASAAAFRELRRSPSFARRDVCARVAAGLRREAGDLANRIAREAGKPIALARAEVERAATTFDLAAECATQPRGEVLALDRVAPHAGYSGRYERAPLGPVLAFSPFNFPLNLVAHKVAPALACGASVLVKPSPRTPLSALALARLVREAGAHPDAMLVLPTSDALAGELVADPAFAVFTFTGSDRVGYALKARCAKKRALLELGGNAAAIVHGDAPELERALDALTASAFAYAGQVCIKTQRVYVQATRFDEVLEGLRARAARLVPEEPTSAVGLLGPMIDEASAARVDSWVDEALASPGGGVHATLRGARDGARLGPAVLSCAGDPRGLRVVEEEAFGPVLVVRPYGTLAEALAQVNASRYGLQAAIFTDSARAIEQAFAALDVGGLVVNDTPSFRSDAMPYGGVKDSGLGREGVSHAVLEYTAPKMLVTRRLAP
ncbi:MAG TPA: aldehyde dehydrogenase family protein [Polyangiaceae bacterium]|nr:aldehyde dehydrogenase family protein [Polyangiaceae bacterium]